METVIFDYAAVLKAVTEWYGSVSFPQEARTKEILLEGRRKLATSLYWLRNDIGQIRNEKERLEYLKRRQTSREFRTLRKSHGVTDADHLAKVAALPDEEKWASAGADYESMRLMFDAVKEVLNALASDINCYNIESRILGSNSKFKSLNYEGLVSEVSEWYSKSMAFKLEKETIDSVLEARRKLSIALYHIAIDIRASRYDKDIAEYMRKHAQSKAFLKARGEGDGISDADAYARSEIESEDEEAAKAVAVYESLRLLFHAVKEILNSLASDIATFLEEYKRANIN